VLQMGQEGRGFRRAGKTERKGFSIGNGPNGEKGRPARRWVRQGALREVFMLKRERKKATCHIQGGKSAEDESSGKKGEAAPFIEQWE